MHSEPVGPWWERSPGGSFDDLAAALDEADAAFPPGATFHYTNLAFGLLGEVVGPAARRHLVVAGAASGSWTRSG